MPTKMERDGKFADVHPDEVGGMEKSGWTIQATPPAMPTREDIAKMKRADVLENLEAHGVSEADCEGVYVPELRKKLAEILFV